MKFEKLTVVANAERKNYRNRYLCKCHCGNDVTVEEVKLKSGHTKSCGCLQKERTSSAKKTHGKSGCKTIRIWYEMRARCRRKSHKQYPNYGGRGIVVCERWDKSFEAFLEDMGEAPDKMSIDRINNNGGYEPENCRWATKSEQGANTRASRVVLWEGDYISIEKYAKIIGKSRECAHYWAKKNGIISYKY
ncbi:MAG: hypothetical protein ACXWT6_06460 [Methylobacter tundripaludum]